MTRGKHIAGRSPKSCGAPRLIIYSPQSVRPYTAPSIPGLPHPRSDPCSCPPHQKTPCRPS
eukprot:5354328-Alexandrium_andersonii.AAC.1